MMSGNEVYESLKSNIIDRIKNPFYGAFIFSWLVFNWKPVLLLLFSKKSIDIVIADLSFYCDMNRQFFYPAAATLALVFFVPILSAIYSFFTSFVGHFFDSGSSLREWLNERTKIKRRNKLESFQKAHEEKIARANADMIENKAREERGKLELERVRLELADLPLLKERIDSLSVQNTKLQNEKNELLYNLKRLFSGEKPCNEHLPSGLRPGAQMQFYTDVEKMRLERESSDNQNDNTDN